MACRTLFLLLLLTNFVVVVVHGENNLVWYGFMSPGLPQSTPLGQFPETAQAAQQQEGWEATDTSNTKFVRLGTDNNPYYTACYDDTTGMLERLKVSGPPTIDSSNGNVLSSPAISNSTSRGVGGLVEYDIDLSLFSSGEGGVRVGNVDVPATYQEAEALGWKEYGCVELMGGVHYVIPPTTDEKSQFVFSPVYDKYGTGKLNAFQLGFGTDGIFRQDFDVFGNMFPFALACTISFCGVEVCADSPIIVTSAHVYFSKVTMNETTGAITGATCQLGPNVHCSVGDCGCCGSTDATMEQLRSHCRFASPNDPCFPCATAKRCFRSSACAFVNTTTMTWAFPFESCNVGGASCVDCFADSPCFAQAVTPAPTMSSSYTVFGDALFCIVLWTVGVLVGMLF